MKSIARKVGRDDLDGMDIPEGYVITSVVPHRITSHQPVMGGHVDEQIVQDYMVVFGPEPAQVGCGTCHH